MKVNLNIHALELAEPSKFVPMNWKSRLTFLLLISAGLIACRDDDQIFTDSSAKLTLRADTMFFDTVFTSPKPGMPMSVNKQFTIVNPHKQTIRTSVRLGLNRASYFRINVDGDKGPEVNDLEILPGDSAFVFVELSIDPNQDPQSRPLIIEDSIEFITNGNRQYVQLRAWGQDAHYLLRDTLCDVTLSDKLKPYVVHGYLYVPENCVLTIKQGVKMHFAPKSWLYVEGTLKIEGTLEEPVVIQGDRLEPDYEETPGQWGGIWLNFLSKDNSVTYAMIKNGTVGIYCDSISRNGRPNVIVKNTQIRNMSFDGLSGKMSNIRAENSIFDNCGRYSFLGLWGGTYSLHHCNFITYNYYFSRRDPTFVLNNIETDDFGNVVKTFKITSDVRNCIIAGSLKEEVGFGLVQSDVVSFIFDYNLLKTEQKLDQNGLKNVIANQKIFKDYRIYDYHLDTLSPAINIGTLLNIPLDFDGKARDSKPDAGAYEFR